MFSTIISVINNIGFVKRFVGSPRIIVLAIVAILSASTILLYHAAKKSATDAARQRVAREAAETANAQIKKDYNELARQSQEAIEQASQRTQQIERSANDTKKLKDKHRKNGTAPARSSISSNDIDILRNRAEEVRSNVHSRSAHSTGRNATKNAASLKEE